MQPCNWYTPDVEVLTEYGFVPLSEIKASDLVASVRDDQTQWLNPQAVTARDLKLPAVRFTRDTESQKPFILMPQSNIMLMGTPAIANHFSIAKMEARFVTGEMTRNLYSNARVGTVSAESLTCVDRLNIALQADGCTSFLQRTQKYRTTFKFAKDRKVDRLLDILEKVRDSLGGISWEEAEAETYTVSILTEYPLYKRFNSWVNFANKSSLWLALFISEMAQWDGSIADSGVITYGGINKSDVDIVQAAATLCGYMTRYNFNAEKKFYSVSIDKKRRSTRYRFNREPAFLASGKWYGMTSKRQHDGFIYRSNGFVFIGG